jgi:hypothetical protein
VPLASWHHAANLQRHVATVVVGTVVHHVGGQYHYTRAWASGGATGGQADVQAVFADRYRSRAVNYRKRKVGEVAVTTVVRVDV